MSGDDTIRWALQRLVEGESLTREEALRVGDALVAPGASAAQVSGFLTALRMKGESAEELLGLVDALRAVSLRIAPRRAPIVDLCGTGGDGAQTFNISTAASLVVAGAGVAVAKHGNRSASSRSGSADILEALGVPIDLEPARAERAVEEIGFAFLFAQRHHPAMRNVAAIRKELGIRTVFNFLGPLLSPAGVRRQLLGVGDPSRQDLIARALLGLGTLRAWVVHGAGGLDEVSLQGPTRVLEIRGGGEEVEAGEVIERVVEPADFGSSPAPIETLRGGDPRENAAIVERILRGEAGSPREAVVANAGAALVVAGVVADIAEGASRAREAIDSGRALVALEAARRFR